MIFVILEVVIGEVRLGKREVLGWFCRSSEFKDG